MQESTNVPTLKKCAKDTVETVKRKNNARPERLASYLIFTPSQSAQVTLGKNTILLQQVKVCFIDTGHTMFEENWENEVERTGTSLIFFFFFFVSRFPAALC